ncbi:MAG: paraquat-inducible protein A [Planctomycetota bacterium]|nr:paraquat-inducible protein A [Planctomycetota bacterium]MEE2895043.1 paraquat-inducible protein A [Planctomycetota bacterium]
MSTTGSEILAGCTSCGGVFRRPGAGDDSLRLRCPHCGHRSIGSRGPARSRERTAAFAASSLILYPPAVLLPVLAIDRLGHSHETSILEGVATLFRDGHGWLAFVVLLCSIVIPLAKLLGLLLLSVMRLRVGSRTRRRVWRLVESLGRWGMLDVLLVAALVAIVKLGDLVRIEPGPGAAVFAVMVVFSLLASACFDPRAVRTETTN